MKLLCVWYLNLSTEPICRGGSRAVWPLGLHGEPIPQGSPSIAQRAEPEPVSVMSQRPGEAPSGRSHVLSPGDAGGKVWPPMKPASSSSSVPAARSGHPVPSACHPALAGCPRLPPVRDTRCERGRGSRPRPRGCPDVFICIGGWKPEPQGNVRGSGREKGGR